MKLGNQGQDWRIYIHICPGGPPCGLIGPCMCEEFYLMRCVTQFLILGLSFTQKASNREKTKTLLWTNEGLSVIRGANTSLAICELTHCEITSEEGQQRPQ